MAYRSIALAAAAATAVAVVLSAPAQADPDTDFAEQLHTFGIYGPRDYNAWLGKISCKRLFKGVDRDLYAAADFISLNLARETSQTQAVQFVGAAIATYCPDQVGVLQAAAR
ncbi:MAG: DUF732 domain-containing protein [Mycobacterium sp.]|jgi:hypothetical protein|nr:DUF732 domain-containing protein [Mycobacterium sp.]